MVERLAQDGKTSRRAAVGRVGVGILVLAGVGAAVTWGLQVSSVAGGLTCEECQEQFEAVHRHVDLGEPTLKPDVLKEVLMHLERCEYCRRMFRQLYADSRILAQIGRRSTDCPQEPTTVNAFPSDAAFTLATAH